MDIYHSSEQYIQHQKAKYCGDTAAANDIMSCKMALQCKHAARNIENYNLNDWISYTVTECIKGLLAKFDQNPKIKLILLNTHNKTLVECSWDTMWGTGCPLTRPGCLNPDTWEGPGLLGTLLMAACEKLKPSDPVLSTMSAAPSPTELPCSPKPPPVTVHMEMDGETTTDNNS